MTDLELLAIEYGISYHWFVLAMFITAYSLIRYATKYVLAAYFSISAIWIFYRLIFVGDATFLSDLKFVGVGILTMILILLIPSIFAFMTGALADGSRGSNID